MRDADYIVVVDDLKRSRRLPEYGKSYTTALIKKVEKNHGFIFLADSKGKLIGLVAGIVEKQKKGDLLERVQTKAGRVLELFVSQNHRSKGIGEELMKKAEIYFKENKCNVVRVDVFSPNTRAHEFYKELGYSDRMIDMVKLLL